MLPICGTIKEKMYWSNNLWITDIYTQEMGHQIKVDLHKGYVVWVVLTEK